MSTPSCAGFDENGCVVLVEKVLGEDSLFNRLFIKHYYERLLQNSRSAPVLGRSNVEKQWKLEDFKCSGRFRRCCARDGRTPDGLLQEPHEFKKRNGYSQMEISQKREALENVLIPYKLIENRDLLLRAGFRYCDVFFEWYNFCGIITIK